VNVRGIVKDSTTGEPLPGANVYASNQVGTPLNPIQGTSTDQNGEFNKMINATWITIKFIGYEPLTFPANSEFTIYELRPTSYNLPNITVTPNNVFKTATFGILTLLYFLITLKK
jgi:hypothetical protein